MSSGDGRRPELGAVRSPVGEPGRRAAPAWLVLAWALVFLLVAGAFGAYALQHLPVGTPGQASYRSTVTIEGEPYPGLTQARVDEAMKTAAPQPVPAHFTVVPGYCDSKAAPAPPEYRLCLHTDETGSAGVDVAGDPTGVMPTDLLADNLNAGWLGTAVRVFTDNAFDRQAQEAEPFPWISTVCAMVSLVACAALLLSGLRRLRERRAWRSAWAAARHRLARIVSELDDAAALPASGGAESRDAARERAAQRAEAARVRTLALASAQLETMPPAAPRGWPGRRAIARAAVEAESLQAASDGAQLALSVTSGGVAAERALAALARPILRAAQDLVFSATPGSNVAHLSAKVEGAATVLSGTAPLLANPPGEPNAHGDTPASFEAARDQWHLLTHRIEQLATGLLRAKRSPEPGVSARASMTALDLLGWPSGTVAELRERVETDALGTLAWDPQLRLPRVTVEPRRQARPARRRRGGRHDGRHSGNGGRGSGETERRGSARPATATSTEITGTTRFKDSLKMLGVSVLAAIILLAITMTGSHRSGHVTGTRGDEHVGSVQVMGGPAGLEAAARDAVSSIPLPRGVDLVMIEGTPTTAYGKEEPVTAPRELRASHPEYFDATSGEPLPGRVVVVFGQQRWLNLEPGEKDKLAVWGVISPEPAQVTYTWGRIQEPNLSTSFTPFYDWLNARTFGDSTADLAEAAAWVVTIQSLGQQVEDMGQYTSGAYGWMALLLGGWVAVTGLGFVFMAWYRRRPASRTERVLNEAAAQRFASASARLDSLLVGWDLTELDAVAAGELNLTGVSLAEPELAVAAAWREDLNSRPGYAKRGEAYQRDVDMFAAQVSRLDAEDREAADAAAAALRRAPGAGSDAAG